MMNGTKGGYDILSYWEEILYGYFFFYRRPVAIMKSSVLINVWTVLARSLCFFFFWGGGSAVSVGEKKMHCAHACLVELRFGML